MHLFERGYLGDDIINESKKINSFQFLDISFCVQKEGMLLEDTLDLILLTPYLCWGLLPLLAAMIGFNSACWSMEWLLTVSFMDKYHIVYGKGESFSRRNALTLTWSKVGWDTQRRLTWWQVCGPLSLALFMSFAFPMVGTVPTQRYPSLEEFLFHFVILAFMADFFLYWGHRVQHENEFLWKRCHSKHHTLITPTPVGANYAHGVDAFLQSFGIIVSGLLIGPHPITFSCYVSCHVSNIALNHSGIDCWWINLITLKILPFRCRNIQHDAHHKFSNYGPNAKNFGEMFWVWDWLFGTLSNTASLGHAQGSPLQP